MNAPHTTASRVIVITGASAGLGATLAATIAARGQARTLVLTARRLERLETLKSRLLERHPSLLIHTIAADLAEREAPARLASRILDLAGGVDVLINNAGLGLPNQFADGAYHQLADQIQVNFTSPLLLTRLLLPSLRERKGMVINIGSAITCVANSALGVYGATKAGIAYWNDALRRELAGTGVRVCLVEPGPFRSEFMDALTALVEPGGQLDPFLENASPWMSATIEEVAGRTADLLDRPRRRVSVTRRFVWLFRFLGLIAWILPPLGDRIVVAMSRRGPSTAAETKKDALVS